MKHSKIRGVCAVVSTAPARLLVRVSDAESDTGNGVDKQAMKKKCQLQTNASNKNDAKKEGSRWLPAVHRALRGFHFGCGSMRPKVCVNVSSNPRCAAVTHSPPAWRCIPITTDVLLLSISCGHCRPHAGCQKNPASLRCPTRARSSHATSSALEFKFQQRIRKPGVAGDEQVNSKTVAFSPLLTTCVPPAASACHGPPNGAENPEAIESRAEIAPMRVSLP